jgi:dihydroneopterin aldolase
MTTKACIELRDLKLNTHIGTYQPEDVVPNAHILDLTLWINPSLALISQDSMDQVFDYDPLVAQIQHLAIEMHYETQERLITRMVHACTNYPEIESLEICLKKSPVGNNSGSLGVRIIVDEASLSEIKLAKP